MAAISSTFLLKGYIWIIDSIFRVALMALLAVIIVGAVGHLGGWTAAAILAAALFFAFGAAAFQIRNSGAALNYPGVDRFFQRVPCYLTIQDKNLRIIRDNKLFRRDFGAGIGDKCYKVYKNADEVCPDCPVLRTFEDGQTHSKQETAITRDGRTVQMIVYTTPVHDEQGKVVGVMEMSTNITEIKELELAIREQKRKFQNLFEGVPCYITVQDRDLRVTDHNERFKNDFGDRIGGFCYEVYKKRSDVCPNCPVIQTFEDGQVHHNEETVIGKDGRPVNMLVHSSPIFNKDGEIVAVMEISTDITEVKTLQRELTYMGRTVAVMAHRIKNILMGLQGGIFVVNTGLEDHDQETMRKGWTMIQRNVARVSEIVKDLLYCSKEREMNFQPHDPAITVRNVFELFQGRAEKENIVLELEIHERLADSLYDPDALDSMVTNLVTNAIDACVNDATEGKDRHRITIRLFPDDKKNHVFEVEDNGPGIPGHASEAIFDDFYSTKGREGTGLGLLVANKVVEEHGGTITFKSAEGRGTTFRAFLPIRRE